MFTCIFYDMQNGKYYAKPAKWPKSNLGWGTKTLLNFAYHYSLCTAQFNLLPFIPVYFMYRKHLPGISYLRLDGSTPVQQRQGIVQRYDMPSAELSSSSSSNLSVT